ncbi:uncharacterized protein GGS25DRAFT_522239 [Hypoxylon fragiforme]|uniref:uncharacterized protein n=1 Tax=Hypoxylon fragiforme TaxID=63214 RepID=UPI0020C72828|nr:uncharacterized protein GGS25DRAFT_522239 [Hypoxylon fragiforme]KAI2609059.1 hypothetical protein GGS25DRAFT_522239 [Hypoxylon fragiforme]
MSSRPSKTHYASSSSTDSSSPSSSETDLPIRNSMDVQPVASVEVMRCLRCHRHVEATSTDDPASTGMIRVGFNLYYCQKCKGRTQNIDNRQPTVNNRQLLDIWAISFYKRNMDPNPYILRLWRHGSQQPQLATSGNPICATFPCARARAIERTAQTQIPLLYGRSQF